MARKKQPEPRRQNRRNAPLLNATEKASTARIVGYARVSTEDQQLDVQLADFTRVGAQHIFVEKISARNAKRPQFNLMMKFLERGDTLYFHALSRVCRGVENTLGIVRELKETGVEWSSVTEPYLNDKTAIGKFMTHMTAAKDELESNQVIERTVRGINEKRAQGMWIGRRMMFDDKQAAAIRHDRKTMTAPAVAKRWKCSVGTIEKYAPRGKSTMNGFDEKQMKRQRGAAGMVPPRRGKKQKAIKPRRAKVKKKA